MHCPDLLEQPIPLMTVPLFLDPEDRVSAVVVGAYRRRARRNERCGPFHLRRVFKVSALARARHPEVREGFLPRVRPDLDRQLVGDAGDRNALLPATRGRRFDGLIDDVRIYNRALTATEIKNDMNAPVN
ncbi:LamG-like jellyroll fold domain-containing protein [Streptosporangium canum]|uniref:LamG-like jellyroll fold domain-containing protein n=1 Tax=Streptosporangium canum TaxID=324952 RepID=UPI0034127B5D